MFLKNLFYFPALTFNKTNNFTNPTFFNDKNQRTTEDIDYNSLQKVVKQEEREQHEPGTNRKVN